MKIYENSEKDTVAFSELAEEQAFKYESFHYVKTKLFQFKTQSKDIFYINAIAISPKIDLEFFSENEMVQPINLVGVIDYDNE